MNKQELKALRAKIKASGRQKQWIADRLSITASELSHIIHGRRDGTDFIFDKIKKLTK